MERQNTMTITDNAKQTPANLRAMADLLDAHPTLPMPYITSHAGGGVEAKWYLHIHELSDDMDAQKTTAAAIIRAFGGTWDKTPRTGVSNHEDFEFTQKRDGLSLEVVVARGAVCERVVVGTHEVAIPATPKIPARPATPEHTAIVEDVEWVCSSLLADTELVSA